MNNDGSQYGRYNGLGQGLFGVMNAAAPEPKIPSPHDLRKKREEAFAFEVDSLLRLWRKVTIEAMQADKLMVAVSYGQTATPVRIEADKRLRAEILAAGWEKPSVSSTDKHATISWREPAEEAEAL